ncbi:peptidase U32 family protein, partial [Paenibacillus riograndensis]
KTTGTSLGKSYILSTKDLNTIDYTHDLQEIDSLKIEGRMKVPTYVANVVSKYRMALDHNITAEDKENLKKTFNRTFT